MEVSERSFEKTIECELLRYGPDAGGSEGAAIREEAAPYGEFPPGGFRKRRPEEYDRSLCLVPRDFIDFIIATQPKEWERLKQHYGQAVKEQFLKRLSREIARRGTLDVLRNGLKDSGCKFRLAYFRPSSGLNEEIKRLHAVRYKLAIDRYFEEKKLPFKALVAFSGTVPDEGQSYTEAGMNGFPEKQTAKVFDRAEYRFLICANKFQTGFDQPLLHTMYVDKKLGGVNAVQTLSRLNRIHPEKRGTLVLDFANEADEIQASFEPYYETTLLSEATDPNLLYEIQNRLAAFPVFTEADVNQFAKIYFDKKATQDLLYAVLAPVTTRFAELSGEEQHDFRGQITDYVRLYAFLAQVLTFADVDLEKFYVFARYLRRLIPADRETLPREVQQNIDMESYRIRQTGSGTISLERKGGQLKPILTKNHYEQAAEQLEPLSQIIAELNERFGLNLGPEHRVTLGQILGKLNDDAALDASARINTRENVRLTFDHKVEDVIQEIVDSNFELYKRITDDRAFGEALRDFLFDHYLRAHRQADELIKRGESKTLEFKATLRWNLRENRKDDKAITHAVLKTIAAFLNTVGGDLLIGVADNGAVSGIERDQFENDDEFMRHLAQAVRNGPGDRASTCIDPRTQRLSRERPFAS